MLNSIRVFKEDQVVKVTAEKLEGSRVSLEVECSHEVVDEALRHAYRRIVRKITIPGFRRGKAPRSLVQRYYGADLYDEAIQDALPQQYIKAVEEAGIDPVDDPEFADIHFVEGEPLRFKAVVSVRPEVEFEDYDSISVPFETPSVSEEDINEQIEMLKERMAELRPMEGDKILESGHYATCHVKSIENGGGSDDDPGDSPGAEPGESHAHKPHLDFDEDLNYLEVGREYSVVPGLGKALIGMKKGEVKQFEGTYPSNEGEEARTFQFEVEVNEVYERHLPEDIEEIAKNVGKVSGEELRKDIREQLMELRLRMAREQHSEKVEEEVIKKSKCDIPEVMIAARAQALLERFEKRLADARMNLENYLASNQMSWDDLKAELNQQAEKEVRRELVLDALAHQEDVQVPEDTVDKVVDGLATEMNQDPKAVKTTLELRGALDDIKSQLRRIEALNLMTSRAAINAGTPLPPVEEPETEAEAGGGPGEAGDSGDAVEPGDRAVDEPGEPVEPDEAVEPGKAAKPDEVAEPGGSAEPVDTVEPGKPEAGETEESE